MKAAVSRGLQECRRLKTDKAEIETKYIQPVMNKVFRKLKFTDMQYVFPSQNGNYDHLFMKNNCAILCEAKSSVRSRKLDTKHKMAKVLTQTICYLRSLYKGYGLQIRCVMLYDEFCAYVVPINKTITELFKFRGVDWKISPSTKGAYKPLSRKVEELLNARRIYYREISDKDYNTFTLCPIIDSFDKFSIHPDQRTGNRNFNLVI